MQPANCTTCQPEPPRSESSGDDPSISFGVVMGVLGGMALVMLFVLFIVPWVRCRKGRQKSLSTRTRSRSHVQDDVESGFLSSRRSSFRNQKMDAAAGPDALLPLIDPMSTFTWSDLRSKNISEDSMDQAATYSFHTDQATTSHLSLGQRSPPYEDEDMNGEDDGYERPSAPPLMHTPTPSGLSPKIDANSGASRTSRSSQHVLSADAVRETPSMLPLSPVSPGGSSPPPSRSRRNTIRRYMDPVPEHSGDTSSRSRQLPSPPESPDQNQPSQGARRPHVSEAHSLPTGLPFRARSGSGSAPPLTSAFEASMFTPSSSPDLDFMQPRSRASSVAYDSGQQSEGVLRPVDAFRRMSTTEIRHRHPAYSPPEWSTERTSARPSRSHSRPPEPGPSQPSGSGRRGSVNSPPTLFSPVPLNSAIPPPHSPYRSSSSSAHVESPPSSSKLWRSSLPPRPPPHTQHDSQPVLVKRSDSRALRPLPPTAFASPPLSPPRPPSHSRTNSVRSVQTIESGVSVPVRVPQFDPLPPLEFDRLTLSEMERKGSGASKRSKAG